jgi:hypothetical protein
MRAVPASRPSAPAFLIIFGVVDGDRPWANTGLISVLPAIGRSIGIPGPDGLGDLLAVGAPVGVLLAVWARSSDAMGASR